MDFQLDQPAFPMPPPESMRLGVASIDGTTVFASTLNVQVAMMVFALPADL
jgi:hypothetical protein